MTRCGRILRPLRTTMKRGTPWARFPAILATSLKSAPAGAVLKPGTRPSVRIIGRGPLRIIVPFSDAVARAFVATGWTPLAISRPIVGRLILLIFSPTDYEVVDHDVDEGSRIGDAQDHRESGVKPIIFRDKLHDARCFSGL